MSPFARRIGQPPSVVDYGRAGESPLGCLDFKIASIHIPEVYAPLKFTVHIEAKRPSDRGRPRCIRRWWQAWNCNGWLWCARDSRYALVGQLVEDDFTSIAIES